MTARDYIFEKLNELKTAKQPQKFDSDRDLEDFIYKALMNKKFRKYSVAPGYQERIRTAIGLNLKDHSAIKLRFGFGGYKLWRLAEAPEVDWAELFTLIYYAQWLKPIADNYEPGVWFDFSTDEVIVERINNIPVSETKAYEQAFLSLIEFQKKYLPGNFRFSLTPIRTLYTPEEFEKDLEDKIETLRKKSGGLPQLTESDRRTMELNVKLKPGQDQDPLWREKINIVIKAYHLLDKSKAFKRAKDKIRVFCEQIGDCIAVGTTKTSIAKFWVGAGALKRKDDSFIEYVLSPSQLENSKFDWEPISINGLSDKNFQRIRVIK